MGSYSNSVEMDNTTHMETTHLETRRQPKAIFKKDLNWEEIRLSTFANWPLDARIPAIRLAKAGFYYSGKGHQVVCFSCGGRMGDWDYGDIAFTKHSTAFPHCKFVKNESNNVPMATRAEDTIRNGISTSANVRQIQTGGLQNGLNPSNTGVNSHVNGSASAHVGQIRAGGMQNGLNASNTNVHSDINGSGSTNYGMDCSPEILNTHSDINPFVFNGYDHLEPLENRQAYEARSHPPITHRLKIENERLQTFGSRWPHDYISPVDLAKAGFFYLQIGDKVQCVFCRGVLTNWERGDMPYIEHVNNFPLCPFVLGRDVGNVSNGTGDTCGGPVRANGGGLRPMLNSGPEKGPQLPSHRFPDEELEDYGVTPHKGPAHPAQASKDARLRSFSSWPQHAALQPEQLADAGFFYIGIVDHTKCFYCDGGLCNWVRSDDPWVEHARWFPSCAWVKLNKGAGFIKSSLELGQIMEEQSATTVVNGRSCDPSAANVAGTSLPRLMSGTGPFPAQKQSAPSDLTLDQRVDQEMQSNLVKAFLRTNQHPPYMVRVAILRKIQMTGSGVRNVDDLCQAIHKFKSEESRLFKSETTQGTEKKMSSENAQEQFPSSAPPATQVAELSLEEENRQLREQRMCKICMDNEVGVVYVPCGHFIVCVQCAPTLKDCPLCRQPIKGTVRTFLS